MTEENFKEEFTLEELRDIDYRTLQKIAKAKGVGATGTSEELIDRIMEKQELGDIEPENLNDSSESAEPEKDLEKDDDVESDNEPDEEEVDDVKTEPEVEETKEAYQQEFDVGDQPFSFSIENKWFRYLLKTISEFAEDEVVMNVDKKGLKFTVCDAAHVSLVQIHAKTPFLKTISCHDPLKIGFDVDKIKKLLKAARSSETIKFHLDPKINRLVIRIGNLTKKISLVNPEYISSSVKPPNLDDGKAYAEKVPVSELELGVKASTTFSEMVRLYVNKAKPKELVLTAKGDTDDIKLPISLEESIIDKETTVTALYPLEFFAKIHKCAPGKTVDLEFSDDYPLRAYVRDEDGLDLKILIAPRIENE